ncbi:FAD-dependent oxidoreductase [Desulfosporosinus youngiae]|uniref:Glycine/D-amino acid oxidase, deaminating n=1 Tax=Desulfosporosinus youngiae DSM 17734 TaxID=768710 RepID=H5Y5Y9_9FIRM|nr:FAD-dependent oxidoreductase [Desulfosporosinus youngiae]EHQ90928.1 glycine/D-amino acid oxidase, deaminating [Desulfosporosinus youngiae DSM 17734]
MKTVEQRHFENQPQSFWMASTSSLGYPSLNEDLKLDVAIVGGGITGILCAYLLSKKGLKIAVLEADRILQGTTGHTTAKITSQHGLIYSKIKNQLSEELAKQYAEANESAIRMIKTIAEETKIECDFLPQSAYVYTLQDNYVDKIQDEADVAAALGIKASYLEEIPLPYPIKAGVRFEDQAQFHPRKFLLALAEKITHDGVQIFEQSRIVDIEEDGGYVLTTNQGKKVIAEKTIIASHYPFYNKHGLYFSRLYPERSYVLAIKAKESYPGGMYITAEDPGRSLRSQSSDKGELILVGGEHHKTGQGEDTTKHYEALLKFADETFSVEDIPYRWSTQDCMTLDGLPYAGHFTSDTPNLYIATGYGKWGMTNSMVSSMILRDLIIEGKSAWQDVYNPSRETILASAKSFIVENLNVAEELIKGKFSSLPSDAEIRPGEGKIIEANGQRSGAYRDGQGTLHVVDTTCTHMGCELNWNSAEKSWDCPCHGSRFSCEGDVVEGPALRPLDIHNNVNTIEKLITDDF